MVVAHEIHLDGDIYGDIKSIFFLLTTVPIPLPVGVSMDLALLAEVVMPLAS